MCVFDEKAHRLRGGTGDPWLIVNVDVKQVLIDDAEESDLSIDGIFARIFDQHRVAVQFQGFVIWVQ